MERVQRRRDVRTVNEIVGAVQEGQPATDEELRLALLCLYYNGQLSARAPRENTSLTVYQMRESEAFEHRFNMLKSEPQKYLGERWTPGTKANGDGRKASFGIAKKAGVL